MKEKARPKPPFITYLSGLTNIDLVRSDVFNFFNFRIKKLSFVISKLFFRRCCEMDTLKKTWTNLLEAVNAQIPFNITVL